MYRSIATLVLALAVWGLATAGVPLVLLAQEQAPAAEQELFRLANAERAQAGLPTLQWNEHLAQAARLHAEEMARRKELSHELPGEPGLSQRLAATGLRFDASAENIASGANSAEIHHAWMQSPGHRANLLNPRYNSLGIAVVRRGNMLYAVQNFAHRVPAYSSEELESFVVAAVNRVRAQDGLPPLRRMDHPDLRKAACAMARSGSGKADDVLRDNLVLRAAIVFTGADPGQFAKPLEKLRKWPYYGVFVVGACFARSQTQVDGTNWVVVGLY